MGHNISPLANQTMASARGDPSSSKGRLLTTYFCNKYLIIRGHYVERITPKASQRTGAEAATSERPANTRTPERRNGAAEQPVWN